MRQEKEVSEQEAFDFFTATWETEEKEERSAKTEKEVTKSAEREVSTSKGSEEEEEDSDDENDDDDEEEDYETANEDDEGDKKKLLASQYIGLCKQLENSILINGSISGRQYDWDITEWKGPELLKQEDREADEVK